MTALTPEHLADPHSFESVGDILHRMRMFEEVRMVDRFDSQLSRGIDWLVAAEQRLTEESGD